MSEADEKSRVFHDKEKAARVEAGVLLHKWFPMAVDHPGAVTARLCYGALTHQTGVAYGSIFFVCGELCSHGELWEYHPYKLAFKERFAKRMFGQLVRGVLRMKYCSGSGNFDIILDQSSRITERCAPPPRPTPCALLSAYTARIRMLLLLLLSPPFFGCVCNPMPCPNRGFRSAETGGCFHRDLKMENVIMNQDFDVKITDYGSLKWVTLRRR